MGCAKLPRLSRLAKLDMREEPDLLYTLQEERCRKAIQAPFRVRGGFSARWEWTSLNRNKRIQLTWLSSPDFA